MGERARQFAQQARAIMSHELDAQCEVPFRGVLVLCAFDSQLEAVAARLPQIVSLGAATEHEFDFTALARRMLGVGEQALFSEQDMQAIRERVEEISARIAQREREIEALRPPGVPQGGESDLPGGES